LCAGVNTPGGCLRRDVDGKQQHHHLLPPLHNHSTTIPQPPHHHLWRATPGRHRRFFGTVFCRLGCRALVRAATPSLLPLTKGAGHHTHPLAPLAPLASQCIPCLPGESSTHGSFLLSGDPILAESQTNPLPPPRLEPCFCFSACCNINPCELLPLIACRLSGLCACVRACVPYCPSSLVICRGRQSGRTAAAVAVLPNLSWASPLTHTPRATAAATSQPASLPTPSSP
jgi:hypothetical protein